MFKNVLAGVLVGAMFIAAGVIGFSNCSNNTCCTDNCCHKCECEKKCDGKCEKPCCETCRCK